MKKVLLLPSIFIFALLLHGCQQTPTETVMPTPTPPTPQTEIQTPPPAPPQTQPETPTSEVTPPMARLEFEAIMMKDSKVMLVLNDATLKPADKDITLDDGMQIKPNGEVISRDSTKIDEITVKQLGKNILRDGTIIMKNGDVAYMGLRGSILDNSPIKGFAKNQNKMIIVMKDGSQKDMQMDTTLMNGLEIKMNGQVTGPNRLPITLKEGQMIDFAGTIQVFSPKKV